MRTGAIFARRARGSCRALKWTALLAGFLVLGSVQAVAQATIEDAEFVTAQPNQVIVTMTEPVYGNGAVELLPGDFSLTDVGATAATTTTAFRIDGLQGSRLTADNSFTVVFSTAVAGKAIWYAGAVTGATPASSNRSIENELGQPTVASTAATAIRGPEQTRELTLNLSAVDQMALEMARKRGQKYARYQTFQGTGEDPTIILPAAVGPPGATITYALTSSLLNITNEATTPAATTAGLHFQYTAATAGPPATAEVRALSGTMPSIIGDYDVTYTATMTAPAAATDSVTFTLKIAAAPEAPTGAKAETVSNSSIRVSWSAPTIDNNDEIAHYELRYRFDDQDDQVPTWAMPVKTSGTATSHTLAGLDPGNYEVQVSAVNSMGRSDWSNTATASTGTGAQKPTLTLELDSTLPEGRDTIPVKVTATVQPSAEPVRTLTVGLALRGQKTPNPQTDAELDADVSLLSSEVEFRFTSNLSSEQTVYLKTGSDGDAENENFGITATSPAVPNVFSKATTTVYATVEDDEVQVYELELPYQVGASKEFMEGYGGSPLPVELVVSPARTVATNYIVSLTSKEDASDYSLLSPSSGSPSSVGTRVSLPEGSMGESLELAAAQNDGDRMDDTITLQLFMADAAGVKGKQLGDDIVLTVLDRHMLPTVTRGAIMVDGNAVASLAEGEMGTVELMVDRGTTTDAIPDNESIKVMLSIAAASEAGADDFRLGSPEVSVGTKKMATFELEALVDDADVEDEMLVLQAEVTGTAANGPGATVDLAAITITDGTMKLVWAKTQSEVETAVYDAKMAGMGDDEMFAAGEMVEVMGSALFNAAEGVTLSYSAESSDSTVASTTASNGSVTVTAMGEGDAMITITAHASMPSSVMINDQTDPREASITFPVEVGLEALSFMLTGPADMNIVEGGAAHANGTMGAATLTVTANRAVGMDTEVMVMRDRALSTAMDSDFMPSPAMITIKSGEMMGSVEITATEDSMAEDMEELVLYAMVGDMTVEGQVKLYIWDAAVPALPIIAQLLLAAFLAIGGYRRYLRR